MVAAHSYHHAEFDEGEVMLTRGENYLDPAPDSLTGKMRQIVFDLLQEHVEERTLPTSTRFLYYELVARGILSKQLPEGDNRSPSHLLTRALTQLRESGHVPWDWISDETRTLNNYTGEADLKQGLSEALDQLRLDPWDGSPPLVITESRSLAGALRDTCYNYRVPLASTNGQAGGFLHTDLIPVLHPDARVLYFGDWDLCGNDIEANARRVLEDGIDGALQWERLALTTEQVKRYKLPKIIKQDRRFKNSGGIHEAVETEALSQSLIVKILTRRLDQLLPEPLATVQEHEERQRRALRRLMERRT